MAEIREGYDKELLKVHESYHNQFTKQSGLQSLLHFLTAQKNEVENWLRANSDPTISHAGSPKKIPYQG